MRDERTIKLLYFLWGHIIKYIFILLTFLYSIQAFSEEKCESDDKNNNICINVVDASLDCKKDYKGYFNECQVKVIYEVVVDWSADYKKEQTLDISSECNSEIKFESAYSSVYNGTKSGFTHESMEYTSLSNSHRFTENMYFQFTMNNMNIKTVAIKSLGCNIVYVSKI